MFHCVIEMKIRLGPQHDPYSCGDWVISCNSWSSATCICQMPYYFLLSQVPLPKIGTFFLSIYLSIETNFIVLSHLY